MDEFKRAVAEVARRAGLDFAQALETVQVPRERERADLTLPCFRFAKEAGEAPAKVAARVVAAFEAGGLLASAEAAGPFANFRVDRARFGAELLARVDADFGRSTRGEGRTVVVDYGSPNIAKPLLFHHLRSSAIGQALCNLHRFSGYEVVGLNFLGDVGTAFGKLMVGIERFGEARDADALNATYVKASALCAAEDDAMARARDWARRLEEKDPEAVRLWEDARRISLAGFAKVYDRLGVRHDVVDGEQMYVVRARELVDELLAQGKAHESEGAIVVDPGDEKVGVLLLRKSDGTTLYQTRDLAAALDRWERYRFDRMLYVVDVAQEHHFRQLFRALETLGHAWAAHCVHVAFGQVLIGGKRAKTREGRGVLLDEVLDEGVLRARAVIAEKSADLADAAAVAEAVGTGAVVFSDIGYPARKNIDFDWDEILSFDGRTGPYLQYVHASACSILRKAAELGPVPEPPDAALLGHDLEWDLVRRIAEFPGAIAKACDDCEPSHVANALYDLAREFRAWHTAGSRDRDLRVLVDDPALRGARLALRGARLKLVDAVRTTLATGLTLLGITPVREM